MKKVLVGILAGAVFFGAINTVYAQETLDIEGVETTRVVIAPPQNALARTVKSGLANAYYTAKQETRAYRDAQQLYFFYGTRHFEPLWLTEGDDGKVAFSKNAQKIVAIFEKAHLSGLNPKDYLTSEINLDLVSNDPAALAGLETAFSAAAMRYAQDTHGGRIDPRKVSRNITMRPDRLNEAATLMELASTSDPARMLLGLEPKHREFIALKKTLAGFYDGTAKEPIVVPEGETLRLGMHDDRVPLMRKRLGLETIKIPGFEDIEPRGIVYDETLVAAVEEFQEDLGLLVDGIVGPATIAALNGGSATSKGDIVANMERWRWMPQDLGNFKVLVNIPEFRVAVMRGDTVVHSTRVVVGKPKNQTPVFSDEIEHIVVNPYWNVPSSIASNEIAPLLNTNPDYIASHNMELLAGGKVIDASAIDWSSTSVKNFRIRQRPGRGNALGTVKFLFPNSHNVYLHDTPSKSLFSRSYRAFSHGCIRVHNPWEFAQALLQNEPKLTVASLESQRGSSERWNNLDRHIPVHIAYFTLRVGIDGSIRSYGDLYGHNKKLKALLGE